MTRKPELTPQGVKYFNETCSHVVTMGYNQSLDVLVKSSDPRYGSRRALRSLPTSCPISGENINKTIFESFGIEGIDKNGQSQGYAALPVAYRSQFDFDVYALVAPDESVSFIKDCSDDFKAEVNGKHSFLKESLAEDTARDIAERQLKEGMEYARSSSTLAEVLALAAWDIEESGRCDEITIIPRRRDDGKLILHVLPRDWHGVCIPEPMEYFVLCSLQKESEP